MQISNALDPSMLDSMSIARTSDSDVKIEVNTQNGGMPPVEASNEIDIDAFMEAWGSADATWDIDSNGKVDGQDLGLLLSSMDGAAEGDTDLQALLDAWGSGDSQWDLNGDGVVDGADLGLYLENGAQDTQSTDAVQSLINFLQAWGTGNPEFDLNEDGVVNGGDLGEFLSELDIDTDPEILEQFMSAWGSNDPQWDFNGDGLVDGADLGILLENNTELPAQALGHAKDALSEINVNKARQAFADPAAGNISIMGAVKQVTQILGDMGFVDAVPSNLPAALDRVPLQGTDAKSVLHNLMLKGMGGVIEIEA